MKICVGPTILSEPIPCIIINYLGQTVLQTHVTDECSTLDIAALNPGIYFVQLVLSKGLRSERLAIIR